VGSLARFLQPASAVSIAHTEAIRAEQLTVVYRYLPVLLAINAAVAGAMVFGLWRIVPHVALIGWFSGILLVVALRAASFSAYRRAPRNGRTAFWAKVFTYGAGLQGLAWGVAGFVLMPSEPLGYQLFVLSVLVGMAAGAIASLAAYTPALYAFLPTAVLPASFEFFRIGDSIHIALGLMTFVYIAALMYFGRMINKGLVESLSLRFANLDLVNQLSLQRDEAERANVAKSMFLAAASHDLRQPLHSLMLFTAALETHLNGVQQRDERRLLDKINASVQALEKLFDTLLDVSRLDAGVLLPQVRDFQLDGLLSRLVAEHAPDARAKGLQLVYSPVDVMVRSDPALLERILRNYLLNAVRYTEQGEIRVSVVLLDGHARLEVRDTGVGVPASEHRAIFDEFFQLGNPERDRTKGLGLGLSIVRRIADLLDHPIGVESEPGRGSCFSVTVPLGESGSTRSEYAAPAEDPEEVSGLRVLVVDDESDAREGTSTLLRRWGCRPLAVASEDEAIAMLRSERLAPDAVVVDYRLRDGRTGVQVIERLQRELGIEIPAMIVTGDTAPERLREAEASGHPLAHKPVRPAVLKNFLRDVRNARLAC
jgi:signal transduction histidine kinase/CheY-like chemotaxis protein